MIRKPAFGKHDLSIFFDDQDQRSTPSVIDRKGKYTQKRTRESAIVRSHLATIGSRVWLKIYHNRSVRHLSVA